MAQHPPIPQKNGVPTCGKCNGTQFQPKRKTSTKLMFGVTSMLAQAKHVACVTCGTMYARG